MKRATKQLVSVSQMRDGLGNRVRLFASSAVLAEVAGREHRYVWPRGARFGADLSELWDVSGLASPMRASISNLLSFRYPFRDESFGWLNQEMDYESVWQIRSAHAIKLPLGVPTWGDVLRRLVPSGSVQDEIHKVHDLCVADRPYVGVMIRANRKSHPKTLATSPLAWFRTRMKAVRTSWPRAEFYVSADIPEIPRELSREFKGVHWQVNKGRYNSKRALVCSVVDAYLLAGASYMIVPYYSSFPDLAIELSDGQVGVENPVETHGVLRKRIIVDALTPWKEHSLD